MTRSCRSCRNRFVVSDDPVADTPGSTPVEPTPVGGPPRSWSHTPLYRRVIDALFALPGFFKTSLNIAGIRVTDLHTLNNALGASIERSVVEDLNSLRAIWDPQNKYQQYSFVRQSQVFPDVRLQSDAPDSDPPIIMGIELKGWFVLAKEGEPSFRYRVNPDSCAPADLLVVFPWTLDEVISGKPRLLKPFVVEARYAALHRNHYWSEMRRRQEGQSAEIINAAHRQIYPGKQHKFNDGARNDSGRNFGRLARGGIMKAFIKELYANTEAGIPIDAWQRFFKIFTDKPTEAELVARLRQLQREFGQRTPEIEAWIARLAEIIAAAVIEQPE